MAIKELTLGEYVDNMEKNGFLQAFGYMFQDEAGVAFPVVKYPGNKFEIKIGSACALGQANINSGIEWVIYDPEMDYIIENFLDTVVSLNDNEYKTIPEIVAQVREEFKKYLDMVIRGREFDYSSFIEGANNV